MSRRLLAVGGLVALAVLAGCTGPFGSGEVDREALSANETYDWDAPADSTLTIERDGILAVYAVANRSSVEVYGFQRFNNERAIDPVALRFRYPNGTVVGPEAMTVSKADGRTTIGLPAAEGQVAMTLPKTGKRVRIPVVAEGSHEVVLPENAHVRYFLLGRVAPRADDRFVGPDGRVHLRWEEVTGDRLVVEYYLERDLVIFATVLTVGSALLVGGLVYFWLQLRELRERRQQVAWEDDSGAP